MEVKHPSSTRPIFRSCNRCPFHHFLLGNASRFLLFWNGQLAPPPTFSSWIPICCFSMGIFCSFSFPTLTPVCPNAGTQRSAPLQTHCTDLVSAYQACTLPALWAKHQACVERGATKTKPAPSLRGLQFGMKGRRSTGSQVAPRSTASTS